MVTSVQISSRVPKAKDAISRTRIPMPTQDISDDLFRLTQLLQTTLELEPLLNIFYQQLNKQLPLGGMVYTPPEKLSRVKIGKPNIHHCDYRLSNTHKTNEEALGNLVFSRSKRFSEKELVIIESMIGPLIYPLQNTLLYQSALMAAMCDPLTNTGNRAAMNNSLQREIQLANRYSQPLSMMVVDIDHFKLVNDNFGHSTGDDIIRQVANSITTVCRDTDLTFRFGGEEFVVLLNKTDASGARVIAERVRRHIESQSLNVNKKEVKVTVSIGTAELNQDDNGQSLFERSDSALYKAKQQGRNQVVSRDINNDSQHSLLEM